MIYLYSKHYKTIIFDKKKKINTQSFKTKLFISEAQSVVVL